MPSLVGCRSNAARGALKKAGPRCRPRRTAPSDALATGGYPRLPVQDAAVTLAGVFSFDSRMPASTSSRDRTCSHISPKTTWTCRWVRPSAFAIAESSSLARRAIAKHVLWPIEVGVSMWVFTSALLTSAHFVRADLPLSGSDRCTWHAQHVLTLRL